MGHALRELVCGADSDTPCTSCLHQPRCLYPLFYDQPVVQNLPSGWREPPRPFVLEPDTAPELMALGEEMTVNVVLFGETTMAARDPDAFARPPPLGRGRNRARVRLTHAWQRDHRELSAWYPILEDEIPLPRPVDSLIIPPLPKQRIRLHLLSPLRIKKEKQYLLGITRTFRSES